MVYAGEVAPAAGATPALDGSAAGTGAGAAADEADPDGDTAEAEPFNALGIKSADPGFAAHGKK